MILLGIVLLVVGLVGLWPIIGPAPKCNDEECAEPDKHGRVHHSRDGRAFVPMNIAIRDYLRRRTEGTK